jgi:DNA invertase Pin-like site-specific DNA recombinase
MARKSRKGADAAMQPQTQKKTLFKVGAYVRLSVEDRKRKGDSIETQQAIIRAFIDERSDLELREIYIDNGLSGQSFERPAFLRIKDDMESGEINCCVTKDLSRLGRNAIDTGYYIESYFPKQGNRFIAVTDGYDSIGGDSGGIMVSMKNMANEYYAIETGRKIRAYHQTLTREGGFSGAHPPYGYLKAANDVHRLIPDEYAGAIVRRIFEMYLSGEGVTAILEWLNAAGILTPNQYFRAKGIGTGKMGQGGLRWSAGVVKAILTNRVYRGDIERGKNKTAGCVRKRAPKTDWVVTEGRSIRVKFTFTDDEIPSREVAVCE